MDMKEMNGIVEEVFGVYNAFTTPLLRYEGSTRQYSLYS